MPGVEREFPKEVVEAIDHAGQDIERMQDALRPWLGEAALKGISSRDSEQLKGVSDQLLGIQDTAGSLLAEIENTNIELVPEPEEFDEDTAYQVVSEFVAAKADFAFTRNELLDYLESQGITVPYSGNRLTQLFENWMYDIEEQLLEEDGDVSFVKLPREKGMERQFAFAKMAKATAKPPEDIPVGELVARLRAARGARTAPEALDNSDEINESALALIQNNPGAKAKQLVELLAGLHALSAKQARSVFVRLREDGKIFSYRGNGSLFYTTEPVEKTAKPANAVESEQNREEGLSNKQKEVAKAMLTIFSGPGRHLQQRMTAKQIKAELASSGFDEVSEREVKKIARALEVQGLVAYGKGWMPRRSDHSSKIEVLKFGLASQKVKDMLRDDKRQPEILGFIETDEAFDPEA
jgi:hypothetical protein